MYEYNNSGTALVNYVLAGNQLISQTRGTTPNYFLQDRPGSTCALTNSTTGAVTDTYSYTAFGESFATTGTTVNPYRYTGQRLDTSTGLYDLRARYYNPALGRFLSQDTYPVNVGSPVEMNRYVYAANSPINLSDPSGKAAMVEYSLLIGGIGGAAFGAAQTYICGGNNYAENMMFGGVLGLDFAILGFTNPLIASTLGLGLSLSGLHSGIQDMNVHGSTACNRFTVAMSLLGVAFSAGELSEFSLPKEQLNFNSEPEGYYAGETPIEEGTPQPECVGANSFSADTPVETKDGEKAISKIQIGDYVLAWNGDTGKLSYERVTDTIHHTDKTIVKLTIDDETLTTTPEHPFYVEGMGWVKAKDLKVSDSIRKADGSTGKVKKVKIEQSTREMYNLTVDQVHTFFVGDGQWLVHNCAADSFTKYPTETNVYLQPNGLYGPSPDPSVGNISVLLGYKENLWAYDDSIPGITMFQENKMWGPWAGRGLAKIGLSDWQLELADALENTNTINFIIDDMNIFTNPSKYDPQGPAIRTHWEMDYILENDYSNKLHLWQNGERVSPQLQLNWIKQWISIRGL